MFALKRLADLRERHLAGNILLEGPGGIGKTELLKQLYRIVYWDDAHMVPFYYAFRSAALRADIFAQDYLNQFIRQYLSFLNKDPAMATGGWVPEKHAIPPSSAWLLDLVEAFEAMRNEGDFYGQLLTALSAPAHVASRNARPVLVLLDSFQLASRLYEKTPGDFSGLAGFFETSMKMPLCPHVITGSPSSALESIFSAGAFRGTAERMVLRPLPDDSAYMLFKTLCEQYGIQEERETSLDFMRFLGCNPFYIRSVARGLSQMHKKQASRRDLWECYSHQISDGHIALYWTSALGEAVSDPATLRVAIRIFMHIAETAAEIASISRFAKMLGASESSVHEALAALRSAGLLQGSAGYRVPKDKVFMDCMQVLYMQEIEARHPDRIREAIIAKYASRDSQGDCFEITLPCAPEAELIAARTLEQIGVSLKLQPHVTERLQMALIEACINAMEHSGSFEKKVFVRFHVTKQRLEMAVESAGRFFDPAEVENPDIESKLSSRKKRGWGLKLIQSIMDEVHIERIDDRTRVLLVKNIKQEEVLIDTHTLQS